MAKKTVETIVKKCLKWHKTEIVLLCFIIVISGFLIAAGTGIYYYTGKIAIAQQVSTIPGKNSMVAQVKMLYDFSRALGIVFTLTGIVSIIFALDRLAFTKDAHRMALLIKERL